MPKVIHYCWFGGNPLPENVKKCIKSWEKYCPDYEIKQWNESNFDVNYCNYTKEAYEAKKWAFVSDYARFKILYENGGIYFDTDVELIKGIDDIVKAGPFMGYEAYCEVEKLNPNHIYEVNAGIGIGSEAGNPLYKEIIDYYEDQHFINSDGLTVVGIVTKILKKHGLNCDGQMQKVENITIYPADYFCPLNFVSGKMEKTQNTRSIHWYSATWQSEYGRLKNKLKRHINPKFLNALMKIKHIF